MFRRRPALAALFTALLAPLAFAQQPASRAEAEQRLRKIAVQISALQEELGQQRANLKRESRQLRAADLEIQARALRLRELQGQRQASETALTRLRSERDDYLQRLGEHSELLEQQVLAAWRLGRESRLKLVLNQDSPARLSRLLAYYDRFSDAQVANIATLRSALADLDILQAAVDAELARLVALEAEHRAEDRRLAEQREQHQALVARLEAAIGSDEARLAELQRDREDLERLLERLSDALADIPADLGARQHPGELRGGLPMPVDGRVLRAFGQARAAGLNWQGWLIEASRGTEVRAIAYGRVAYADWLRGYGLLLIIDHGEGFMSLYGNNESLLFEAGQWVQAGSVIATSGAYPETGAGLYFELRNGGRAVDPATWIKRR